MDGEPAHRGQKSERPLDLIRVPKEGTPQCSLDSKMVAGEVNSECGSELAAFGTSYLSGTLVQVMSLLRVLACPSGGWDHSCVMVLLYDT